MSNLINKVKDAVKGDHHSSSDPTTTNTNTNTGYDNPQSTNHGPSRHEAVNKMNPAVDSDRDHRGNPVSNVPNVQQGTTGTQGYNQPHQQHLGGQAPVGNTYDNTASSGGYSNTQAGGFAPNQPGGLSQGTTNAATYDNPRSGNFGPHSTAAANVVDPRVDSTQGSGGYSQTAAGTQYGGTTDNYGSTGVNPTGQHHHGGLAANTQATGHHQHGTHQTAGQGFNDARAGGNNLPGPAPNTAGPHKSDLLNRLNPQVDSDLDGSQTVGRDKTYNA